MFEPVKIWDGSIIQCPNCKCENLHQFRTDVRQSIGAEKTIQYTVITARQAYAPYPPERGLQTSISDDPELDTAGYTAIRFWCEDCDFISRLSIKHHKGLTQIQLC